MTFTIIGPPRTKKNHGRMLRRGARVFHVPSLAAVTWEAEAIRQLDKQKPRRDYPSMAWPVTVSALIYRDADRGDLVGYLQAIGDALERSGVILNDKLIHSWDGSRPLIDRKNPRVELEITPMETT